MSFIDCEILGVSGVVSDFKKYGSEAEKAIDIAVKKTGLAVESDAKKRLKGMFGSAKHWISGRLASSIYNRKIQNGERIVGTDVKYAPYIEFGTGSVVFQNFDFDADARRIASQYKGSGVRKVNIKGDSFMNWAAVNQQNKNVERIKEELNKINR